MTFVLGLKTRELCEVMECQVSYLRKRRENLKHIPWVNMSARPQQGYLRFCYISKVRHNQIRSLSPKLMHLFSYSALTTLLGPFQWVSKFKIYSTKIGKKLCGDFMFLMTPISVSWKLQESVDELTIDPWDVVSLLHPSSWACCTTA